MSKEKTKLEKNELEKVDGGYGIIHKHDGFKTLIDDNGIKVDRNFVDTIAANEYAKNYEEVYSKVDKSISESKKYNFKKGKDWEEY